VKTRKRVRRRKGRWDRSPCCTWHLLSPDYQRVLYGWDEIAEFLEAIQFRPKQYKRKPFDILTLRRLVREQEMPISQSGGVFRAWAPALLWWLAVQHEESKYPWAPKPQPWVRGRRRVY